MKLVTVEPDGPLGQQVLRDFFADVVSRYWNRLATEAELDRAMREDPSDDLVHPHGLLVVALAGDEPLGCGGIRFCSGGTAELTRIFVRPAGRRQGLAAHIVAYLEHEALARGRTLIRLDTRSDLIEARALYTRIGYREVEAFNSDPYAEHWFEKQL